MNYSETFDDPSRSDLIGLSLKIYEGGSPLDDNFRISKKEAIVSRV